MKLTAQDLMIGDLVRTLDSTHKEKVYAKIWAIEEGQTSILVKKDICNWFVDIEWIEPIPLTPEILEKNGFYENKYGEFILDNDLDESEIYIVLQLDKHEGFWWTINSELITKLQYVHQLQQAMRLCKIRKEIEL